jgi:hypothetical protein
MSRTIDLVCAIDIEQTAESFHAHAIPEDIEINAGDTIFVHDAPAGIGFGECYTGERRATLRRANFLIRLWTEITSIFEIFELYEVGFQPIADAPRTKG